MDTEKVATVISTKDISVQSASVTDETLLRQHLAELAHDFFTPLSGVRLSISLLKQQTRQDENLSRRINTLELQTNHIEDLVDELATMLRLDLEVTRLNLFCENPSEMLSESISALQILAAPKNIAILHELDKDLSIKVLFDKGKLRRAIFNIMENAIAHTERDGIIQIINRHTETHIVITITDNGRGIPSEKLPYIFDRFYRADDSRSIYTGKLGLGLSITHKIVHAHGGYIEVESELGLGTSFSIYLPIVD